jgi:hypothetical protein
MILVDNKIEVAKLRLFYIVSIITGSILIIYSSFSASGTEGKILSLFLGVICYIIFLYLLIIKPEYTYFAIENNSKLLVRNYAAFPVFRKYKAFEVSLSSIYDYELKKALFNQIIFIRILVRSQNKIGKYPWISLSAVPQKDLKKLYQTMDKLLQVDKTKKNK